MTRLRWSGVGCEQSDRGWFVQTEHVRGEGVCYFLDGLSFEERLALERSPIETSFYGRGGKGKVKAAAQALADLLDGR